MQCPVCAVELKMSERQGVEIDYCPQCRGVWLDRGELDKIIERSARVSFEGERGDPRRGERESERRYEDRQEHDSYHWKKRKRGSFLEDIFDF